MVSVGFSRFSESVFLFVVSLDSVLTVRVFEGLQKAIQIFSSKSRCNISPPHLPSGVDIGLYKGVEGPYKVFEGSFEGPYKVSGVTVKYLTSSPPHGEGGDDLLAFPFEGSPPMRV